VDRPETAPAVAAEAGVPVPVALLRIGHPRRQAPRSNRRDLADVLIAGSAGVADAPAIAVPLRYLLD